MTIFNEGDRVRIAGTESAIGTVTAHRGTGGFESFVGIHWDTGAFGFANPNKVERVFSEADIELIGDAYRRALEAVGTTGPVDPISIASQNRTETGTDMTDWQTRAEQAEAKVAAVRAVADKAADMARCDPDPTGYVEGWCDASRGLRDDLRAALGADR